MAISAPLAFAGELGSPSYGLLIGAAIGLAAGIELTSLTIGVCIAVPSAAVGLAMFWATRYARGVASNGVRL